MAIDDLQDFKLDDLYSKLALDEDEFDNYLASLGLLNGSMICSTGGCNRPMILREGSHGNKIWRCNRKIHRPGQPKKGYKVGTFFEKSYLSYKQIFKLSYLWAMRHSVEYAVFETGITEKTVIFWFMKFRRLCKFYFRRNPIRLGGDVEGDETFMTRKHAGRGRQVRRRPKWVFAMIERGSGNCYLQVVRRRDSATLMPIILRRLRPNSTFYTDEWRSYRMVGRFGIYRHRIVNHGVNFVDPLNANIHTQTVENLNGRWKRYVRMRNGIKDGPLRLHLVEFQWRQRFDSRSQVFFNFWSQVSVLYPCQP
jgi:transposase